LCCSGDTETAALKGQDDAAAGGYDYSDDFEKPGYEPGGMKYSPRYGGGGQYVMGMAKSADSDTFV